MTRSEATKQGIKEARKRYALAQEVNIQFKMFEIGVFAYAASNVDGRSRKETKEYPYRLLRGNALNSGSLSAFATEYFTTIEELQARAKEIINFVLGNISHKEWADIELERRLRD